VWSIRPGGTSQRPRSAFNNFLTPQAVAPAVPIMFFGSSLTFMLVYLWARRNPGMQIRCGHYPRLAILRLGGVSRGGTNRWCWCFSFVAMSSLLAPSPSCPRGALFVANGAPLRNLPPSVSTARAPRSLLGLVTFNAPYLPWVLLGFSALLGHDVTSDLLGIAVGHAYYYLAGGWRARVCRCCAPGVSMRGDLFLCGLVVRCLCPTPVERPSVV
jgi:hypothetical protein